MTYDEILKRMLANVPDTVDKREGSIIFDALAPAAIELAQMYVTLEAYLDLVFVDTSSEDYLTRLCAQFGIERQAATNAIRKAYFDGVTDIEIGSKFTINDLVYTASEKMQDGIYKVICETAGVVGNKSFGKMVPVSYIEGLKTAILQDVLIPGDEEETDDELKTRYFEYIREPAFGGNIADYKRKIKSLDGVGAVKVFPVWNGDGTVKLVALDSSFNKCTDELIKLIENEVRGDAKGFGIAPIGHIVTAETAKEASINISVSVTASIGADKSSIEANVRTALENYLLQLRKSWESTESLIIRIAHVESKILDVDGVVDISSTRLNKGTVNVVVGDESIPILGEVVIEYA